MDIASYLGKPKVCVEELLGCALAMALHIIRQEISDNEAF